MNDPFKTARGSGGGWPPEALGHRILSFCRTNMEQNEHELTAVSEFTVFVVPRQVSPHVLKGGTGAAYILRFKPWSAGARGI